MAISDETRTPLTRLAVWVDDFLLTAMPPLLSVTVGLVINQKMAATAIIITIGARTKKSRLWLMKNNLKRLVSPSLYSTLAGKIINAKGSDKGGVIW